MRQNSDACHLRQPEAAVGTLGTSGRDIAVNVELELGRCHSMNDERLCQKSKHRRYCASWPTDRVWSHRHCKPCRGLVLVQAGSVVPPMGFEEQNKSGSSAPDNSQCIGATSTNKSSWQSCVQMVAEGQLQTKAARISFQGLERGAVLKLSKGKLTAIQARETHDAQQSMSILGRQPPKGSTHRVDIDLHGSVQNTIVKR